MKSEEVILIGATGAAVGVVAHDKFSMTTGNALLDAAIGIGIAAAGWFTDYDGGSDFIEGAGIGYFFASVL